jgi:hypothetical protein
MAALDVSSNSREPKEWVPPSVPDRNNEGLICFAGEDNRVGKSFKTTAANFADAQVATSIAEKTADVVRCGQARERPRLRIHRLVARVSVHTKLPLRPPPSVLEGGHSRLTGPNREFSPHFGERSLHVCRLDFAAIVGVEPSVDFTSPRLREFSRCQILIDEALLQNVGQISPFRRRKQKRLLSEFIPSGHFV